jgi:hypothetical protein
VGWVACAASSGALAQELVAWHLDDTSRVGGLTVERVGAPIVRDAEVGRAIHFGGAEDALLVAINPLQGWARFTVEVLLRPEQGGLVEQRLLHVQEDGTENRLLVETRVTADGWYLDTFLKSGENGRTLIRPEALHPLGAWHWVALVFDGTEMRHFVNGELEAAGPLRFAPFGPGRTSLGVRLNRVSWFKGDIREVRFHPRALAAGELSRVAAQTPPCGASVQR